MTSTLEVDLPPDLGRLRLPAAVAARLQSLLDRQDASQSLGEKERGEAEGLAELAESLSLLKLREARSRRAPPVKCSAFDPILQDEPDPNIRQRDESRPKGSGALLMTNG